jgi:signal transduction histidine kinase
MAGQLLLVTALALFVAQGLSMILLIASRDEARLYELSGISAARIIGAVEREASDAGRDRAPRGRVRIVATPPASLAADHWPALSDRVTAILATSPYRFVAVRSVSESGGSPTRRVVRRPHQRRVVHVAAQMGDGRWVVARSFAWYPENGFPTVLVVQTLLIYLLLLGPIIWMGWRVSQPLKRLSRAMDEPVGLTGPEPVTVSGPGDVRDLIAGFNAMRDRIAAMLSDKDRMLGAIGHDLRTPLASMRVRVESVADDTLRARMVDSIESITAMLDDILSLARAGRSLEQAAATDLAALTDALAEDYRDMERDVTYRESPATIAVVRRDLLSRAIRNLVDNALKYGTRARLWVETVADTVAIVVADDGPGIPADRIAGLVEAFARDEGSRNRETGGAGLGLAIARTIVEHEGGRLVLTNAPGGGLEARIELPR